jgi:hypothetical protein
VSDVVSPDAGEPAAVGDAPGVLSTIFSEKLLRWLLFGVLFATLPVMVNFFFVVTQALSPSLSSLVGQGELLIISAGVAATGAGELQGVLLGKLRRVQIFVSAMAYLVVCVSSVWFASVATEIATRKDFDHLAVADGSIAVFVAAIATGGCCVALSGLAAE